MRTTGVTTFITALTIGSTAGCSSDDGGDETSATSSAQTSGQTTSGETTSGETTSGETTSGETTSGSSTAAETTVATGGTQTGTTTAAMPWVDWDMLECGTQTCGPTELCVHDEWNGATDSGDGDMTYCTTIPPECLADFEACELSSLCQYEFDSYADGHLYCSCDDRCI